MNEEATHNIFPLFPESHLSASEMLEKQEAKRRHPTSLFQASDGLLKPMCPRCEGFIPNNMTPGRYPGAISRVNNKTEICSDCGREEALSIEALNAPWPVSSQFPVAASRAFERMLIVEDIR